MILVLIDLTSLIAFLFHQSFLNQLDHSLCFQTLSTAFCTPCTGKDRTCSVMRLSIFRLGGDNPILILGETPFQYCFSAICKFHILRMGGGMCCVLQKSRIAASIGIFSRSLNSPSTWLIDFPFHHFSVTVVY